jgi:hypothetical protein
MVSWTGDDSSAVGRRGDTLAKRDVCVFGTFCTKIPVYYVNTNLVNASATLPYGSVPRQQRLLRMGHCAYGTLHRAFTRDLILPSSFCVRVEKDYGSGLRILNTRIREAFGRQELTMYMCIDKPRKYCITPQINDISI